MKRVLTVVSLISAVLLLAFSVIGCSKPKDDDQGSSEPVIETNKADVELNADDIFGSSDSSGSREESSSGSSSGGQSGDEQDQSSSTEESGSQSGSSSEESSNSSIDYEDPNNWTKPVGGDR